jgi:hypothetical protein
MEATNAKSINHGKQSRPGAGRGGDGRFRPGVSGNPHGRPQGSRDRASVLAEQLLDGRAQALAEKAVELALGGDVTALRLCLERLLPVRRERSLTLQLPSPMTAEDITAGFARVVEALTRGELTPSETTDLARRIEELEERAEDGAQQGAETEN